MKIKNTHTLVQISKGYDSHLDERGRGQAKKLYIVYLIECLWALVLQVICVTMVQWSRSCLNVQINGVLLPATLFSVSLYRFFLCLVSFFQHYFCFWPVFFILNADPAGHALGSIYIWSLSPEFYFGKGISKSSWSAYWPSLLPEKNHKLSRHVMNLS